MEQRDLVAIAAIVVAALIVVTIVVALAVRRRRRRREVVGGYEDRIARLGTSYDTLRAGRDALETGAYEHALDCGFRVVRRATPGSYRVAASHALIGSAAFQLGRYRTAAEHLALALEQDARGDLMPSPSSLLTMLAEAELALARLGEAGRTAAHALTAAQDDTERAHALQISGTIHLMDGALELARGNARFASDLTVDPVTSAATEHLLGRIAAADDHTHAHDHLDRAAQRFEEAHRWSDAARVVGDKADLLERVGQPAEALACWEEALRLLGHRPGLHGDLATIYSRLAAASALVGDLAEADRYLAAAETEYALCELPTATMMLSWARARMADARGDGATASSAREDALDLADHLGLAFWRDRIATTNAV